MFHSTPSALSSSSQLSSPWRTPRVSQSSATKDDDPTHGSDGTRDESIMGSHIRSGQRLETSSSEDEQQQVYLSVFWEGGKIGMAYYDVDNAKIHMMPDATESTDFSFLKTVLGQIQPTSVVTSAKQDDDLIDVLLNADGKEDTEKHLGNFVKILPSIDYSFDICKRRILALDLPSIPDHYTEAERSLYLSSFIPFDKANMLRAMGGLLRYLDDIRAGGELEEPGARVPVLSLTTFTLEDVLYLDEEIFSALQIFPSGGYQHNCSRELSLFGEMDHCRSSAGRQMLRKWFLRPTKNLAVLKERHENISFLASTRRLELTQSLELCLRQVKQVQRILVRMCQSQASVSDWKILYQTIYNAFCIRNLCRAQPSTVAIFSKVVRIFTEDLEHIASWILKIVDFEESIIQKRFVVKPNVDQELDERKRTYNGLPDFMTKVAREEMAHLSDDIAECHMIYLPQLGYLLVISMSEQMKQSNDYSIPGLEFMFQSNNSVHYKSAKTRELDRMLGDTQCEIRDQETNIMHRLQTVILEHTQLLEDVVECIWELDCLLALASVARERNYVQPQMNTEDTLEIKDGRHPLQELCCSPYVPNDTYSGGPHSRVKLLTGPNTSGKSVYLKQVALIVYLAHTGSFVPAKSALIPVMDGIYTRINTVESVSKALSTFAVDLNQVSLAFREASERSLVIQDEFGKGTQSMDGMALFTGFLKCWLQKGTKCPHLFASTHFHTVVEQKLLPNSPLLQYQTMDTVEEGSELVFLYQLREGSAKSSYACHIAAAAGLPEEIVVRGKEVSELIRKNQHVNRVECADTETQYKRCSAIVDRFLDLDLEKDDVIGFLKDFVLPVHRGTIKP